MFFLGDKSLLTRMCVSSGGLLGCAIWLLLSAFNDHWKLPSALPPPSERWMIIITLGYRRSPLPFVDDRLTANTIWKHKGKKDKQKSAGGNNEQQFCVSVWTDRMLLLRYYHDYYNSKPQDTDSKQTELPIIEEDLHNQSHCE